MPWKTTEWAPHMTRALLMNSVGTLLAGTMLRRDAVRTEKAVGRQTGNKEGIKERKKDGRIEREEGMEDGWRGGR